MVRNDAVRGNIILRWSANGSPEIVNYAQLLVWAKECVRDFTNRGINPAPKFFGQMEKGNEQYVKTWLKTSRFPFRIVNESISASGIKQAVHPPIVPTSISGWRVCLKCGRLNLVDAVFCSYCGQSMPKDIN